MVTLVTIYGCSSQNNGRVPSGTGSANLSMDECINEFSGTLTADLISADSVRGAQLYDKWWSVNGQNAPDTDHDVWQTKAANSPNDRSGSDTWRCKECHGWDYEGNGGAYGNIENSHYTGFPGILDAANTKPPIEVFCAIYSGTNDEPNHVFFGDNYLSESDIGDLTKFITDNSQNTGVINLRNYIEVSSKQPIQADAAAGERMYEDAGCGGGTCHGRNGDFQDEPLGELANDNPWEFIHKIRFGHPGNNRMPAFAEEFDYTPIDATNITLFVQQTLGGSSGDSGSTGPGNVVRGGKLFDKWWKVSDQTTVPPTGTNPLFDRIQAIAAESNGPQVLTPGTVSTTYRCKHCHGWDYAGAQGAYGPGSSNYTGVKGLLDAAGKGDPRRERSADEIRAIIADSQNGLHRWSDYLSDRDIEDLVAFIKQGIIDTEDYISRPTRQVRLYDFDNGKYIFLEEPQGIQNNFRGLCALCHNNDGNGTPPSGGPVSLGPLANDNPWEVLHKVRFGQPGASMPNMYNGYTLDDAVDVLGFTQTLDTVQ